MIQFAAGAGALKELVGLLGDVIEDPDTYKKIEGLRLMLCKLTGVDVDKNGLVALLEESTQGEAYTGKWEQVTHEDDLCGAPKAFRLRVPRGYMISLRVGESAWTRPVFYSD